MEEILDKVSDLIEKSNNIPIDIKPIVKAICRGYIRESNGKIPIEGIINVCNTVFVKIDENDKDFQGENIQFGETNTNYDLNCNILHKMSYVHDSNYIKMITILTHELGHVITESKPCTILENGVYPFVKRTTTFNTNVRYQDNILMCDNQFGYRMSDGFLESICTKIFNSREFRQELKDAGYDLKDYIYKDDRLFPSRVYDEYKACFELYDYIMDGALFDFSCMSFSSNEELLKYINNNKLDTIFQYLDKSNDALWALKGYENKEYDDKFKKLLDDFLEHKETALALVEVLAERYGKNMDDEKLNQLYDAYKNTLVKQKLLPIPVEYGISKRSI